MVMGDQHLGSGAGDIFLLEGAVPIVGGLRGEILFGWVRREVLIVERYIVLSFCRKG